MSLSNVSHSYLLWEIQANIGTNQPQPNLQVLKFGYLSISNDDSHGIWCVTRMYVKARDVCYWMVLLMLSFFYACLESILTVIDIPPITPTCCRQPTDDLGTMCW